MIDKKKAIDALGMLVREKKATVGDIEKYKKSVEAGLSYAELIVMELGPDIGFRYLQEEFVQALHFTGKRVEFDKLSLPEVLQIENSSVEPWHKGEYSLLSGPKKFQQEAAEPWHPSLRGMFAPDADVSAYFNRHPKFFDEAVKILTTVNGNRPPNEEDLKKLTRG